MQMPSNFRDGIPMDGAQLMKDDVRGIGGSGLGCLLFFCQQVLSKGKSLLPITTRQS